MKQNKLLLINELVIKAYDITLECLECTNSENVELTLKKLDERERIINAITHLSKDPEVQNHSEFTNQVYQVINKIHEEDQKILEKLASLKSKLHFEIAKVFKTKENFKGYNLNSIK